MNIVRLRKTHKWLALFAGVQVLIWSVSGLYMVSVDLDIIHGDHLVKPIEPEVLSNYSITPLSSNIIEKYSPIESISLQVHYGQPVYEVHTSKKTVIVNALTGQLKKALTKEEVLSNVKLVYAGDGQIKSIERLASYPKEIGGRKSAVWRVRFDDVLDSTLYFHDKSGRLISKRTDLWRVFDIFWMLHIMDYREREDISNWLFRILASLSLLMSLVGSGLLYYRLKNLESPNETLAE